MNWIKTKDRLPEFGVHVLVFCRIYGQYIGSYERIDPDCECGNWHDGGSLGVLPPTYWMSLPDAPNQSPDTDKENNAKNNNNK